MPAREIEIEIEGLTVAAREHGAADGAPVLALHGWLDNAASFETLAPLLPASLRVIALDLPGHGLSSHRHASAGVFFLDWVREVFAVADALSLERFSLLGHSMGAGIASLCAGTLPGRVVRMALVEGLGPMSAPADRAPEQLALHITGRKPSSGRPYPTIAAAAEVRAAQPNAPLSPRSAELLVSRAMRQEAERWVWRHDRRLRTTSSARLTEEQVLAFLQRIEAPALLIQAKNGWPYPEDLFAKRVAAVPDLTVIERPGNHHLHLDTPESVAAEIGAFLIGEALPA
ncbi:MAG: alpha/beta hydrolase [Myxococcales bacterium]|nr:alpha/beta hydrolase [Myxococcales bacterium]